MKSIFTLIALLSGAACAQSLGGAPVNIPEGSVAIYCIPVTVVVIDPVTGIIDSVQPNVFCADALPITQLPTVPSTDVKANKNNAKTK